MTYDATVAVLGTAIMGAAMARNLLEAGMEVRVWRAPRRQEGAQQLSTLQYPECNTRQR